MTKTRFQPFNVNVRIKISALWGSMLFIFAYVDLFSRHALARKAPSSQLLSPGGQVHGHGSSRRAHRVLRPRSLTLLLSPSAGGGSGPDLYCFPNGVRPNHSSRSAGTPI